MLDSKDKAALVQAGTNNSETIRATGLRKWLPRHFPIAIKLAMAIGILITVTMTAHGILIIKNQTELLNEQILSTGRTLVNQMAESAKEPLLANDSLQMEILAHNLATSENIIGTAIYSDNHRLLASSGQHPFEPYAPYEDQQSTYLDGSTRTLIWQWPHSPKGNLDAIAFMSPVRFKDITAGHVLIAFSRQEMNQAIEESVHSITSVTIVLLIIGIGLSYFMGRKLTQPIQHLINASRAIGQGEYDFEFTTRRKDEIGFLMNSLNGMAQGLMEKEQVQTALSRHVSPNVAKEILNNLEEVKLGGNHVFSTVMFIDIVGFTAKSETMKPQAIAELLNEFYSYITDTVHLFKGTIDKYIGDCAMIVFGVPEPDNDHVYHGIAYAVFLQRMAERINNIRISKGKFPVHYRIGVNAGEMLAGNMGTAHHMQYTVVGDSVNLASRLASMANTDQIMITEEIYNLQSVRKRIVASKYQAMHIRGKSLPVTTYLVHDVAPPDEYKIEQLIDKMLARMEERL